MTDDQLDARIEQHIKAHEAHEERVVGTSLLLGLALSFAVIGALLLCQWRKWI